MKYKNDIIAIWDLHWNIDAYYWNLKFANIIDEEWNWIAKNSICVFVWDILADRHNTWMDIMFQIKKLKKQAQESWGDVLWVCWNHDYRFLFYLCTDIDFTIHKTSFVGLLELRDFADEKYKYETDYYKLRQDRKNILNNMKSSQYWSDLFDIIYEFNLVYQYEDILFIHTNPTPEIFDYILKYDLDYINNSFQEWLKSLIKWDRSHSDKDMIDFFEMSKAFLLGNRRDRFPYYQRWWYFDKLKEKWINFIVNWHNWFWWVVDKKWKVKIIDIDYSYGKYPWIAENQKSVLQITKDWEIFIWARELQINNEI